MTYYNNILDFFLDLLKDASNLENLMIKTCFRIMPENNWRLMLKKMMTINFYMSGAAAVFTILTILKCPFNEEKLFLLVPAVNIMECLTKANHLRLSPCVSVLIQKNIATFRFIVPLFLPI